MVLDSAEAMAQAESGQIDLEQTIMCVTSPSRPPTSQLLLLEPAVELVGTWFRVTGNDCGITGNAYFHWLCTGKT